MISRPNLRKRSSEDLLEEDSDVHLSLLPTGVEYKSFSHG